MNRGQKLASQDPSSHNAGDAFNFSAIIKKPLKDQKGEARLQKILHEFKNCPESVRRDWNLQDKEVVKKLLTEEATLGGVLPCSIVESHCSTPQKPCPLLLIQNARGLWPARKNFLQGRVKITLLVLCAVQDHSCTIPGGIWCDSIHLAVSLLQESSRHILEILKGKNAICMLPSEASCVG